MQMQQGQNNMYNKFAGWHLLLFLKQERNFFTL